jgi:16S rRNA A1518/A1519 N6-dimethyltransferase RsmA/KsgA/DIM1 with predicted DNA glycosylase/AP lyase activity
VNAATRELVADEIELLRRLVPLEGARLVELGCGKAELARRLLERSLVASVTALEVDKAQHAANLAEVHRRFERHRGPGGARFVRPVRVNVLRRPA